MGGACSCHPSTGGLAIETGPSLERLEGTALRWAQWRTRPGKGPRPGVCGQQPRTPPPWMLTKRGNKYILPKVHGHIDNCRAALYNRCRLGCFLHSRLEHVTQRPLAVLAGAREADARSRH